MYSRTWKDPRTDVTHIVAMPQSYTPFTACCAFHWNSPYPRPAFEPGLATCVVCWAREFVEWHIEASPKSLYLGIMG